MDRGGFCVLLYLINPQLVVNNTRVSGGTYCCACARQTKCKEGLTRNDPTSTWSSQGVASVCQEKFSKVSNINYRI